MNIYNLISLTGILVACTIIFTIALNVYYVKKEEKIKEEIAIGVLMIDLKLKNIEKEIDQIKSSKKFLETEENKDLMDSIDEMEMQYKKLREEMDREVKIYGEILNKRKRKKYKF